MRRGGGMRGGHRGGSRIGGHSRGLRIGGLSRGFRTNRRHHGRYNRGYRYGSGYYYGRGGSRGPMIVLVIFGFLLIGSFRSLSGLIVLLVIIGVIIMIANKNKKSGRPNTQGGRERLSSTYQANQPNTSPQVLYNQKPSVKFCSGCGSALLQNSTFCAECGTKVI